MIVTFQTTCVAQSAGSASFEVERTFSTVVRARSLMAVTNLSGGTEVKGPVGIGTVGFYFPEDEDGVVIRTPPF